jgi:hypothetical protein
MAPQVARADVLWGDFEDMQLQPAWGALTNSGIKDWTDPAAAPNAAMGTVITAPSGPLAGSKVLKLTGQEQFNYGQTSGGALGFDFLAKGLRQSFFDNDQIEFDWYAPPNGGSAGYSQLYNIILNSQGGGFVNVDGYSQGNANDNQFYFTGFNGALHHVVINYTNYKNAVLASANPDAGGWLQYGIQPNAGGGAPAEIWFDNFIFSLAPNIWNVDADGNWSSDGNWSPAAPVAAGKVASFDAVIMAPRTVTLDVPETVGQLKFNNTNKYTIAGTSPLTLDSTSGGVGITVSNGSHDITAPLTFAQNANITISAPASVLTITNLQGTTAALTKTGGGLLAVNHLRAGNVTVSAGTLSVLPNSTAAGVSRIGGLSIASGAKLDLGDNKLITTSPIGTLGSANTYTGVTGLIQSGRNGGTWTGGGIVTTQTNATSGNYTSIGVALASDVRPATATATALWGGQTITGTDTLVMYTYGGDATLDGKINIDDYVKIDSGIAGGYTGWVNGDFNYDGKVSIDDYITVIDANIGNQSGVFPTASGGPVGGVSAVPEPTAISLIGVALMALTARRRGRGGRRSQENP